MVTESNYHKIKNVYANLTNKRSFATYKKIEDKRIHETHYLPANSIL